MSRIPCAALLALLLPFAAAAQPRPSGPEWARDRRELREDARAARDDRLDLQRAEALLADYDRAARERNRPELGRLEDLALAAIRQEWNERRQELERDRAEARGRPEAREARRDRELKRRTLDRLARIGERLYALGGRYRGGDVARKRGLLADFVKLARVELRQDRRELREDRRELRDDRRDGPRDDRYDDRRDDRRDGPRDDRHDDPRDPRDLR